MLSLRSLGVGIDYHAALSQFTNAPNDAKKALHRGGGCVIQASDVGARICEER